MKLGWIIATAGCMSMIFTGACTDPSSERGARYEGADISDIAEIRRDKKTKSATLHIDTSGEWQLYSGNRVRTINLSQPILEGRGKGTYTLNVPDSVRSYFQLVTEEGRSLLAERLLPMEGGYNFRDMGGYKTTDGRFVKWGRVFRSDDLHSLTDKDVQYLSSIPIITVVDFRSKEEIEQLPDRVLPSAHNTYAYSINPGNLTAPSDSSAFNLSILQQLDMDSVMRAINIQLVTDNESIDIYRKFFNLLEEDRGPLLFHCTAGKDRTGMAAALFLLSLGVDEETVMNDYLLSNRYIKEKFAGIVAQYPSFAPLAGVDARYLQAAIDRIKEDHGTIDHYLQKELDVDIDKIKENYLYK